MPDYKIAAILNNPKAQLASRMGPLDQIIHLINFLAPALVVALFLAVVARWIMPKVPVAPGWIAQIAINFIAGSVALGLGLWFFGRDGKMASYGALVVFAATSQWVVLRGWR